MLADQTGLGLARRIGAGSLAGLDFQNHARVLAVAGDIRPVAASFDQVENC
jgi:hypothetical protein